MDIKLEIECTAYIIPEKNSVDQIQIEMHEKCLCVFLYSDDDAFMAEMEAKDAVEMAKLILAKYTGK